MAGKSLSLQLFCGKLSSHILLRAAQQNLLHVLTNNK